MNTTKLRVAVYARQMFKDDVIKTQVTDQLATCRKLFVSRRAKRINSADVYMEMYTQLPPLERREFQELKTHIESIGLDELFIYSMDCISTDLLEVLWFEEFLKKSGVKLRVAVECVR